MWQVDILLENFVTSNSNIILPGPLGLLQNLHKLFCIDLQGPDGPAEILVDEDLVGGHEVVIQGIANPPVHIAVSAELLQRSSYSNKIVIAMLRWEFL